MPEITNEECTCSGANAVTLRRALVMAALSAVLGFAAGQLRSAFASPAPPSRLPSADCLEQLDAVQARLQALQDRQAELVLRLDRQAPRGGRR